MKNIITILFLAISSILFAQVPQGISYQAVAFDTSGNPVASSTVGIKISILENSVSGTVIYEETHSKNTNAQGLFNLHIGQGSATVGSFSTINWGNSSKYLKVEMDPNGGTSYSSTGTSELMSVPYALYAETTNFSSQNVAGIGTNSFKSSNFIIIDGYNARAFSNGTWNSQTLTDYTTNSDVIEANGNFIIIDGYNARAFSNNTWNSQALNDYTTSSDVIGSNGNFIIIDGYNARAFSNGIWSSQSLTDYTTSSDVIGSNGNFIIIDGYSARAFSNGVWSSQTLTDYTTSSDVIQANGSFIIIDGYNARAFSNGVWSSQPLSDYTTGSDVIPSNID